MYERPYKIRYLTIDQIIDIKVISSLFGSQILFFMSCIYESEFQMDTIDVIINISNNSSVCE